MMRGAAQEENYEQGRTASRTEKKKDKQRVGSPAEDSEWEREYDREELQRGFEIASKGKRARLATGALTKRKEVKKPLGDRTGGNKIQQKQGSFSVRGKRGRRNEKTQKKTNWGSCVKKGQLITHRKATEQDQKIGQ